MNDMMMPVLICISLLCLCVLFFLCQCEVIKTDSNTLLGWYTQE